MRGQAELTNANEKISAKSGLDTEYITHWSYGIGETWSLLIPKREKGEQPELLPKIPKLCKKQILQYGSM